MARYDLKCWRESRNGKAYVVRIGSAWTDQKGTMRVSFDALPIPDKDGRVEAFLEEQKPRDEAPSRAAHPAKGMAERKGSAPADFNDEVPFACEWR